MNNRDRWHAVLALGLLAAASAGAQAQSEADVEAEIAQAREEAMRAQREAVQAQEEARAAQAESMRELARAQQEAQRQQRESQREFAQAQQEAMRAQAESARELARARSELEAAAQQLARLSAGRGGPADMTVVLDKLRLNAGHVTLGLNVDTASTELGVRVVGVTPGGPAAEAGVLAGDTIVAIDDTDLTGNGPPTPTQRLLDKTQKLSPGQTFDLRVLRDGDYRDLKVTTREQEAWKLLDGYNGFVFKTPTAPTAPTAVTIVPPGSSWFTYAGTPWRDLELVTLTPGLGSYFGVDAGLLVVRAPTDGALGLRDGDVILEISGREAATPEHALRILGSFEPEEMVRLTIMRQHQRETLEATMPAGSWPFVITAPGSYRMGPRLP